MLANTADGISFLPRNTRTRAILAILALAEGAPVPRTLLIKLLWPSRGPVQAQASLRQSIHELRRCLAPLPGARIVSEAKCLAFHPANIWIDAIIVRMPECAAPEIEDIFRGPLLSGLLGISDNMDAWVRDERSKLSAMIRPRLEAFPAGPPDHGTIRNVASPVLAHDTSRETALATLANTHMDFGDRTGAFGVYRRCLAEPCGSKGHPAPDGTTASAQSVSFNAADTGAIQPFAHGIASRCSRGGRTAMAVPWRGAYLAVTPMRAIGEATAAQATRVDWQIISNLCKFENLSCSPVVPNDGSGGSLQNLAAEGFNFLLEGCLDRAADQDWLIVRLRDLQLRGEVFWSQQLPRTASCAGPQGPEFAATLAPQIAAEIAKHQALGLEKCPELEKNV